MSHSTLRCAFVRRLHHPNLGRLHPAVHGVVIHRDALTFHDVGDRDGLAGRHLSTLDGRRGSGIYRFLAGLRLAGKDLAAFHRRHGTWARARPADTSIAIAIITAVRFITILLPESGPFGGLYGAGVTFV